MKPTGKSTCTSFPFPVLTALLLVTLLTSAARGQVASVVRIEVPGSVAISLNALNQSGHVVGSYQPAPYIDRAFYWSNGVAVSLGTLGGAVSSAYAVNNVGQAAGYSATGGEAEFHAFLFDAAGLLDLGSFGGLVSSAAGINDAGQVAGTSYIAPGVVYQRAFLASRGSPLRDLGTLGGNSSSAVAVNSIGQVAGQSTTEGDDETHAFLYSGGVMRDLGTLGGNFSFATGLNNQGLVVGSATTADDDTHAFAHNGLSMFDLGTLGGSKSQGYAVNDAGQIIGDARTTDDLENHGFLYSGGVMLDLGTLGGGYSSAWALNNSGVVIGVSANADGVERPFLWRDDVMVDLNTFLPPGSGWDLEGAYLINDTGQVAGYGTYNGEVAWFLMSFSVNQENHPPVASAGPDQIVECAGDNTAVTIDATASSDPDGDALTFEWFSGNVSLGTSARLNLGLGNGSYTFTVRVTDSVGAMAEDSVVVTVADTTPPVVVCPVRTAPANKQGIAVVPNFLEGLFVTDNCSSRRALTVSQSPARGTVVRCGTNVVVITATDAAGNQVRCSTALVVVDVTPPVFSCPKELTRAARSNCVVAVPDLRKRFCARDNCTPADELVVTQDPAPGTLVTLGQYTVTTTVADASGNSTTCQTRLIVVDRVAPRFSSLKADPEFLTPGSGELVPVTLALTVTDNCDASPVCRIVSVCSSDPVTGPGDKTAVDWVVTGNLGLKLRAENFSSDKQRVYTVKVSCTDASGNVSCRSVSVPVRKAPKTRAK